MFQLNHKKETIMEPTDLELTRRRIVEAFKDLNILIRKAEKIAYRDELNRKEQKKGKWMDCLRVSLWGLSVPGLLCEVKDNAQTGQTLHLVATPGEDLHFPYGEDLMPQVWTNAMNGPLDIMS